VGGWWNANPSPLRLRRIRASRLLEGSLALAAAQSAKSHPRKDDAGLTPLGGVTMALVVKPH